MKNLILILLMSGACLFAQTDLVYPWVTNNSLFRSTVVINNLGADTATVNMTATRADGSSETVTHTVDAFDQMVSSAADLFPTLGDGAGYAVRVTSDASDIKGALVVVGTDSPSGSSPAQADVLAASSASAISLFSYLPLSSGFSAPVVVNMGDAAADVVMHAFQGGQLVASSDTVTIEAGHPFTALSTDLFPGVSGDIYMVAESTQPVLGMAFIFNEQREPSMSASSAIDAVPAAPTGGGGGNGTAPTSGVYDTNELVGENSAHDKLRDNLAEFGTIASDAGLYASSAGAALDWLTLSFLLPGFLDDDITNGEALNVILDFDTREELDVNTGEATGSGNPVAGIARMVVDQGDGTILTLYLCLPTDEGMAAMYNWFDLPPVQ